MKKFNPVKTGIGCTLAALLVSCNSTQEPETASAPLTDPTPPATAVVEEETPLDTTLFELPLEVNNDNIDTYFDEAVDKPLSPYQITELGLKSLENTEGSKYYVLGEINLSETFKTRLVFRNSEWNEWKMWLVSYDSNGSKVGDVNILYGDNVEWLSETFSTITEDGIFVTDMTYGFEEDEESGHVETYSLVNTGIFLLITQRDLTPDELSANE